MGVKIRYKKCTNGMQSIYLDIHHLGVRRNEYLNIKVKKIPANYREREEKRV